MVEWTSLASDFRKFHAHPLNVALHLVTTPLMFIGARHAPPRSACSLRRRRARAVGALAAAYGAD